MNLETIVIVLVCILAPGFLAFAFISARNAHQLALHKLDLEHARELGAAKQAQGGQASASAHTDATVPKRRLALVHDAGKPTCASCTHFDHELGQKELSAHPPMAAASAHIPPWRMGHTMKVDADGKHLPIAEQGISKEMLALRWEDMGACLEHQELRAPFDTCPKYERADRVGAA